MENLILRRQVQHIVFCLASGAILAACGGESSGVTAAGDTRLLANGEACSPAWVASQAYIANNKVSYAGRNYSAAYFSQGSNPSTNSGTAGSGQAWISGFFCGNTTTTTSSRATTTTSNPNPTGTMALPTTSSSSVKQTTTTSSTKPPTTTTTTKSTTSTTAGTASCKPYVAGTAYTAGQIVKNAGAYYSCTVAGWCSSGAAAYEPGVGWAWNTAWSTNSGSTCAPTTTTTTTLPPQPCYAPWSSTTSYMAGAKVSYSHVNYVGAYFTQYLNPSTNSGAAGSGQPWVIAGPCF